MKIRRLHRWNLSPREAIALQKKLRSRLVVSGAARHVRWIAGADAAFANGKVYGAVVLWDRKTGRTVEEHGAAEPLRFPYVPGLLSFREAPALIAAFRKLRRKPDLVLLDGQGIAHPRRFGIASHLGLFLGVPTVGVAKSRLIGEHRELPATKGSRRLLMDRGETVGIVCRSREKGRPLYLSPGHRIGIHETYAAVKQCFRGYRLPEPTRLADRLSKRLRRG